MLYQNVFGGLIFPWLISRGSKVASNGPGVLFPFAPKDEEVEARKSALHAPVGWSICATCGWAIYRRPLERLAGYELVLYGLRIENYTKRQIRADTRSIKISKEEIENYIESAMRTLREMADQFTVIITTEVHETRSINTDIKQISEQSLNAIDSGYADYVGLRESLIKIRSLSEITTVRTDFLDFVANPSSLGIKRFRPMQPYKKFDKVRRSLEFRAREKSISMDFTGSSFGYIEGLDIFEIIPYLVIQNAIKYSPKRRKIHTRAWEDSSIIEFTTANWGPYLEEEEGGSIFEWGFRGNNAAIWANSGSGVGLYFLRELVISHHGKLEFRQETKYESIDSLPFSRTEVTVQFPRMQQSGELFGAPSH